MLNRKDPDLMAEDRVAICLLSANMVEGAEEKWGLGGVPRTCSGAEQPGMKALPGSHRIDRETEASPLPSRHTGRDTWGAP